MKKPTKKKIQRNTDELVVSRAGVTVRGSTLSVIATVVVLGVVLIFLILRR
jgi:hypothetical protein